MHIPIHIHIVYEHVRIHVTNLACRGAGNSNTHGKSNSNSKSNCNTTIANSKQLLYTLFTLLLWLMLVSCLSAYELLLRLLACGGAGHRLLHTPDRSGCTEPRKCRKPLGLNKCIYIYIYTHMHLSLSLYTYIYIYMYVCIYIYIERERYVYIQYIYIYMYTHMYQYISYVCICVCIYVYIETERERERERERCSRFFWAGHHRDEEPGRGANLA